MVSCSGQLLATVVVVLLSTLSGRCDDCTLGDFQDIQRDLDFHVEKTDGRWYAHKVYGMSGAMYITWYTVDWVPTPTGFVLYSNIHFLDGLCLHTAIVISPSALRDVFTDEYNTDFQTMVVAASDRDLQHALVYLCGSNLTGPASPCSQSKVLLMSRHSDGAAAVRWMTSLNQTSLPCYNDSRSVTVRQVDGCPMKQMVGVPGRSCLVTDYKVQEDFDLVRYVSKPWKEILRLPAESMPPSNVSRGDVHSYTIREDGNVTCSVSARTAQGQCLSYPVNMTLTSTPGKLIFHDPNDGPIPYDVVHTDYDHFALVVSCRNVSLDFGSCLAARGWLWGRESSLDRRYRLQANALITDMCINPAAWVTTTHSDPPCATEDGSSLRISFTVMGMLLCVVFFTA